MAMEFRVTSRYTVVRGLRRHESYGGEMGQLIHTVCQRKKKGLGVSFELTEKDADRGFGLMDEDVGNGLDIFTGRNLQFNGHRGQSYIQQQGDY